MITNHSCFGFKVEAERAYHQKVLEILDQLEEEVCILLQYLLFIKSVSLPALFGQSFCSVKHAKSFMYGFDDCILIDRWCLSAKKLKHPQPQQEIIIWHHHHHLIAMLMEDLHPLLSMSRSNLSNSS
jgi:hypothetical protein